LAASGVAEVRDLARAGATAAGALEQAKQLPGRGGLALLEIGGNDLLGSTSAAQFERDLDRLLSQVARPGRAVVMFELPLPPLCNEYGRVQRRLAAQHHISLIPKRLFIAVLTTDGATLDSIHLSPQGHQQIAALVRSLIEPSR
jgi:acyl-CoA thioesterase-1